METRRKERTRAMNKVILLGRLTRDPESRWTQKQGSQEQTCVARFTLAVEFENCVIWKNSDGKLHE